MIIMSFILTTSAYILICCLKDASSIPPPPVNTTTNYILVGKCCEEEEIMFDGNCYTINRTKSKDTVKPWRPIFVDDDKNGEIRTPAYKIVNGIPKCGNRQQWPIYELPDISDKLVLLPDGRMRHYVHKTTEAPDEDNEEPVRFYDYKIGQYCLDKVIIDKFPEGIKYAVICAPEIKSVWKEPDIIIRRVLNPIGHMIAVSCLLIVAVVYFVLPELCDLVGNIVTTIAVCLILAQMADVVRIFSEYNSELSFLLADSVVYTSIMAAFFWLNGMGYYIWHSFRSRNTFLTSTDGRKYCYYSLYIWSSALGMGFLALFAHLFFDINKPTQDPTITDGGVIGWLGISVFFVPISVSIMVNLFFYLSTVETMKRMSVYGRIHHKLRYQFNLFTKIFVIMTCSWMMLILTWMRADVMFYIYIFVNVFQAITLLYVTVVDLKNVRFLIRKACCYDKCIFPCCRPEEVECDVGVDWGDEMMAMNDDC